MTSVLWLMTLLVCFLISAADAAAQDFSWGVKGGVVFATLDTSGRGAFDTSADAGGVFGGFVGIGLGPHVRLQPEFYWSVRRFAATGVPTPFSVSARGLEVPLLLQVRFPRARATQAALFGGPQFARIGRVRQQVGGTSIGIDDDIGNGDVSLAIGGGIERTLTKGAIGVDLRTTIGVRNLQEANGGSLKSRGIHLLVGYRF